MEEETQEEYPEWQEGEQTSKYEMDGFFDYKNLMINPASEQLKMGTKELKKLAKNIFTLINRDLQLGFLDERSEKIIFLHFHLASELIRFEIWDAAVAILQKAYTMLVMSNSRGGFQRKLEATSIRVSKLEKEKKDEWMRLRRRSK